MSDPSHLRKRKKDLKSKPEPTSKSGDANDATASKPSQYTSLIWITLLILSGVLLYLYPDPVINLANEFLGLEDLSKEKRHAAIQADVSKRDAVVEAFKHAWRAYERDAMGDDEYHPISGKGTNLTEAGGIGYTVIDSIDTMLMMGLERDYERARKWVETKLDFDRDANFNTFETTIRVLGGLLAAYHLTNDKLYLDKSVELADRLLPVFETPSGLPWSQVNLARRKGVPDNDFPMLVSTAEAATLQLEFRYLSFLTDNEEYWEKAENVMKVIKDAKMPHGLASIFITAETGQFVPSAIRLGSRGDSYYEYLLKQYIQTNRTEDVYLRMYDDTMDSIHRYLVQRTQSGMLYTAELIPEQFPNGQLQWRLTPKQDHLVCFLGGSLMLGATVTGSVVDEVSIPPFYREFAPNGERDWKTGEELIRTCMATHDTATGLSPEIVHFRIPNDGMDKLEWMPADWYIKGAMKGAPVPYDARYILRPETVESLFIAYRLTGDDKYRDDGWKIFSSIEKYCKVPHGGYASIINVDDVPPVQEDKMETFLMSETLKYLYLLFEDESVLPLDKYVFNTEAHAFPIFTPTIETGFS